MNLMESMLQEGDEPPQVAPEIVAFVEAALARYPDLDEASGDESPWASSPLMGEALEDLIYIPMTYSGAENARDVIVDIASSLGLVCYDPQAEQLLPTRGPKRRGWFRRPSDQA